MSQHIKSFESKFVKAEVPVLRPGYEVAVHQKIKEGNKERVQVFKGMVIAVNPGSGLNNTFTVRKISEGIGVEKVFPVHSPNIVKIDVSRAYKIRQSKLYYLRDRSGKALRLPEVELKLETEEFEQPKVAEPVAEAPQEEAAVATEAPVEEKAEVQEEASAEEKKEA